MVKELTAEELKALADEFAEYIIRQLLKGYSLRKAAKAHKKECDRSIIMEWRMPLERVLDLQLFGIEEWDFLTGEQKQIVAEKVVESLKQVENHKMWNSLTGRQKYIVRKKIAGYLKYLKYLTTEFGYLMV
jgi:hypothetical protein